jgi:Na+/proline symporter
MVTTFFFARLWRRAGILTEIEFLELRYSGKTAAFLRGFKAIYLGLIMNILIIGWVNLAMITIIQEFFQLSLLQTYEAVGGAMILAVIYTSISGIWGVAVTDVIQFTIAIIGTTVLAFIVVNSPEVGGISGLKSSLPESTFRFFPVIGEEGSEKVYTISAAAFFGFLGVQWWASWYPGQEPGGGGYVAQRIMSTKTERGSVYATLFFQIAHYCLRPWPWILVALSCLVLYPELSGDDLKVGYVRAMKEFLPPGLKGLLLAAFLGAYMSTISTQLNWGAGYLVNDLYKRFMNPLAQDRRLVFVSRLSTVMLMALGLGITWFMESISAVWLFIMECGAGLGLVLILRWYWWRINAISELTATIAPLAGYVLGRYALDLEFPMSFFFTVSFTTIAWLTATYMSPPESLSTLNHFFERVRPDGNWNYPGRTLAQKRNNLLALFVCWLAAIVITYAILFLTGKIIFGEWEEAGLYLGVIVFFSLVLAIALKRTEVFRR